MDRWTSIVAATAAVTVAAGAFAVGRAVATDDPLTPPTPAVAAPTTSAPAGPSSSGATASVDSAVAGSAAPAAAVEIEIAGFEFSPAELTVAVGSTVTWVNRDGTDHSIVSADGTIVSPPIAEGATFSFTFTTPGEFAYICGFHPEMTGTITVEA